MNPVRELRNSTWISLLCITITCVASMAFAAGATKGKAGNLQLAPSGDSREKIVRALRGAEEVKSLRIRQEWFHPGETRVYLVERVNPDRYHGVGQDSETFYIGEAVYERKRNGPLERTSFSLSLPARKPDINEEIKKLFNVRLIGPETLDGIAVLAYEYEQNGPPGLPPVSYKIWIRVKDGLVHRTEHEEPSRSKTVRVVAVTNYYDYNAEIIIELPEQAAREAAESWLRLLEAGRCSDSWAQAASVLKERYTEESWKKRLGVTGQAGCLCPIKFRELVSIESVKSLPRNHEREGVLLSYKASFDYNVSALQKLELVLDEDRVWRVANYTAVVTDRTAERTLGDGKGGGIGGGIGDGKGGGMGSGNGSGLGPGRGSVVDAGVAQGSSPATSVDTRPIPLNSPTPRYSEQARNNNIQGTVTLRLLIGADGLVKQVRVVRGLPDGLNDQAIQVAYQLRFQPAMKDGKPVAFWQPMTIVFSLGRN
jgi:TonB family protein